MIKFRSLINKKQKECIYGELNTKQPMATNENGYIYNVSNLPLPPQEKNEEGVAVTNYRVSGTKFVNHTQKRQTREGHVGCPYRSYL